MPFKFFHIPIRDPGPAEAELNAFLASHKVLAVERRWVEEGPDSFWSFCIDYMTQHSPASNTSSRKRRSQGKDYKELLSPEDFAQYAKLRDLRKEIAQAEAVPIYTVFTNEQLAQMVQTKVRSKADVAQIEPDPQYLSFSSVTNQNMDKLIGALANLAKEGRSDAEIPTQAPTVHRPMAETITIGRNDDGSWQVSGRQAERAVALNDLTDLDAMAYVQDRLAGLGVDKKLAKAGARQGDMVRIGDLEFEYDESIL